MIVGASPVVAAPMVAAPVVQPVMVAQPVVQQQPTTVVVSNNQKNDELVLFILALLLLSILAAAAVAVCASFNQLIIITPYSLLHLRPTYLFETLLIGLLDFMNDNMQTFEINVLNVSFLQLK